MPSVVPIPKLLKQREAELLLVFCSCKSILFTSSESTNIERWMMKQEYKLLLCSRKASL